MVGHDDRGMKCQAVVVKSQQTTLYRRPDRRLRECPGSIAGIQPLVQPVAETGVKYEPLLVAPWLRVEPDPEVAFLAPLLQFFLRQGVGEAECDPVDYAVTSPMG